MKNKLIFLTVLIPMLLASCGSKEPSSSSASSSSESSSITSSESTSTTSQSSSESSTSEESSSSESSSEPSSSSSSSGESTIAVTSVSLNKVSFDIYVGDSPVTLSATVSPSNATNKNVSWVSSNSAIASVNSNGKVTPNRAGTATISVVTVDGSHSASCTVTVKAYPETDDYVMYGLFGGASSYSTKELLINSQKTSERMLREVTLYKDDIFMIHMYGNDWYGYKELKSSIPSGLVSKGTDNYIKVEKTGIYDIYSDYNYSDGGHIYLTKVGEAYSVPVSKINLSRTGVYMVMGREFQLYPVITPSNATNQEVTWDSSKKDIATVSENGVVYGKKKGKTIITATTKDGNKVAKCEIFVNDQVTPDFYLVGNIHGESIPTWDEEYAAYPDTGGNYKIPDVVLYEGDEVCVYNPNTGQVLKNSQGLNYVFKATEYMKGDFILNILSATKNYLSFQSAYTRNIKINYPNYTNSGGYCGWIFVSGDTIDSQWIKSSDLELGSTYSMFTIPKEATSFRFVRALKTAEPGSTYDSIGEKYNQSGPYQISEDVNEYTVSSN